MVTMTTTTKPRGSARVPNQSDKAIADALAKAEAALAAAEARAEQAEAALAAAKASRARDMTAQQAQVVLAILTRTPDQSLQDVMVAAGATKDSHGLLFRVIDRGYADVSVTDEVVDKARKVLAAQDKSEDTGDSTPDAA